MHCLALEKLYFEREDLPLFGGLSASWQSGSIVQIAGHNGCGKTTLLRMIAGLLQPSSGRVLWDDKANRGLSFQSKLLFLGHQVGVKMTMTALENLRWFFALHGRKSADKTPEVSRDELLEALERVGLRAYADTPAHSMSAGQQRRIALARLFISEAPLWILDEPFTAIDKHGVSELEQRIDKHAASGGIVLLTTHQRWSAPSFQVLDLEQYKGRAVDV
ncbi:cytochrome c biogenesis heme-transporting ATPase CcmA [Agaribacterium haliotis]|uniref:cytochrome c biogenesis heme-transporting ATPase CcmA n=1 Tax=Agaribacterium haliotis TaxID=2013869 RepID=UPI000BB5336C|nr:cytochrome c biogenesis heme-transporting ATPase CcmA [Agaribacterium haliotis]